jgi:hypothetical protein
MYKYRVTVESLSPPAESEPLRFEVENHDDLFAIVSKMSARADLDPDSVQAFAVGLKLFGEVVLRNRSNPLFAKIMPALGEFMRDLKGR